MAFIGRWSPFHKGHSAIIQKKLLDQPKLPILIMIRETGTELFPTSIRAEYIKIWMTSQHIQGTIMIVPNIEGIYWGRSVGYNTGIVDVDPKLKRISATEIRQQMKTTHMKWKQSVANGTSSYVLTPTIVTIMTRGLIIWLTGCPSSGKTTIAKALEKELHKKLPHLKTQILDGDDIRNSPLASHVGFTKSDRAKHILRMAYLAKLFADHGIIIICAFVSPDRSIRQKAKAIVGPRRFLEIYVRATKKTRMHRDTKGLYKKASQGKLSNLTGFNAKYEIPNDPDIICDTERNTIMNNVEKIFLRITK